MKKRHKHDWKICTLMGSEFKCSICQGLGREYKVWDKKKKAYKYVIYRVDNR